jgi:hypothetical protein
MLAFSWMAFFPDFHPFRVRLVSTGVSGHSGGEKKPGSVKQSPVSGGVQ